MNKTQEKIIVIYNQTISPAVIKECRCCFFDIPDTKLLSAKRKMNSDVNILTQKMVFAYGL